MSLWSKVRGTAEMLFQVGLGGTQLKSNAGVLEARNSTDSSFVPVRVAEPDSDAAAAARNSDLLLNVDPVGGGIAYAATYTGAVIASATWTRSPGNRIKSTIYTYTGGKLSQEVRSVYAVDGVTVVAQLTIAYSYTGMNLTGKTYIRNV